MVGGALAGLAGLVYKRLRKSSLSPPISPIKYIGVLSYCRAPFSGASFEIVLLAIPIDHKFYLTCKV